MIKANNMVTPLQTFLNMKMSKVTPIRGGIKAGDLWGLEIEMEGQNVVPVDHPNLEKLLLDWTCHVDGSLRGESNEWVFNGPVLYKKALTRVDSLFDYLAAQKAKIALSNRTSVHVHYNVADKQVYQVVNMFILFTILEDILDRYCGEDRNGNLFCLSSRHAQHLLYMMNNVVFDRHQFNFNDNDRYASFNIAAVNKFGTIEFRAMRGLDNADDVKLWLSVLNEFVDYSCYKMRNPSTLIEEISVKRPVNFIKEVFPINSGVLLEGLDERDIDQSVFEGLRLVQMMCYKIGTEFDKVRLVSKDFWATFADVDVEPELDVKPEEFLKKNLRAHPIRVEIGEMRAAAQQWAGQVAMQRMPDHLLLNNADAARRWPVVDNLMQDHPAPMPEER
jgi:Putative amidoligase enzyme